MDRERITREVIKAADALKKKYKLVKLGQMEDANRTLSQFKPIIEPLKTLVASQEIKKETQKVKTEPLVKSFPSTSKSETTKRDSGTQTQLKLKKDKATLTNFPEKVTYIYESEPEKTTEDSLIEYVQTEKGKKEMEDNIKEYEGHLIVPYVQKYLEGNRQEFDDRYGIRFVADGKTILGDTEVFIEHNDIQVNDKWYKGTKGLFKLLFLKDVQPNQYTKSDLENYRKILLATNAHLRNYSLEKAVNRNNSIKYRNIISQLFPPKGKGLMYYNKPIYEYYNNPNEIVERLQLLMSSKLAGHSSHDNEITSIIEELKEDGYIQ